MRLRWCWWCTLAAVICSELVEHVVVGRTMPFWSWAAMYFGFRVFFGWVHHKDDDDHRKKKRRKVEEPKPVLVAPVMTRTQ